MNFEIEVLLVNAKSRDSRVGSIIETARLREGYTKFHEISFSEARERAILRFHGGLAFCGVTVLTCSRLLSLEFVEDDQFAKLLSFL